MRLLQKLDHLSVAAQLQHQRRHAHSLRSPGSIGELASRGIGGDHAGTRSGGDERGRTDGLRGTDNELADVARRYRVAYSVNLKPPYTVMHSNAVFFFDRDGRIRLVTTDTTDSDAIAEDVRRLSDM